MGKLARNVAAFLVIGPLCAMFAEPFFEAIFNYFKIDTASWAVPLVTFVIEVFSSPVFFGTALVSIGCGVGVWAHWLATRVDAKNDASCAVDDIRDGYQLLDKAQLSRMQDIITPEYMVKVENFDMERNARELDQEADEISNSLDELLGCAKALPEAARKRADEEMQSTWRIPHEMALKKLSALEDVLKQRGVAADLKVAPNYDRNHAIPVADEEGITDEVKLFAYRRICDQVENARKIAQAAVKQRRQKAASLRDI